MADRRKPLTERILAYARRRPKATPLQAKRLLRLESHPAVSRALSRLSGRDDLFRIAPGVYILPMEGRFGKYSPSIYDIVNALAKQEGFLVSRTGADAANALGLSTQVPMKEIFLTTGKPLRLSFRKHRVEQRPAPPWWKVALGDSKAGRAIRAIDDLLGHESVKRSVKKLKGVLDDADREELARAIPKVLESLSGTIRELAHVWQIHRAAA